jgi:hypothetical protein
LTAAEVLELWLYAGVEKKFVSPIWLSFRTLYV